MQWSVRNLLVAFAAVALAGCGGSSSNKNTVAAVNVNPASISIVAGQVVQLSVSAVNASNIPVSATVTFNSSNPSKVTVSPSAFVCGGVWDSTFVTCNGHDASGNPVTGTAVITATSGGITSGPVNVSVHQPVTSIQVTAEPPTGPNPCISHGKTQQFSAKAFNGTNDITSSIGQFSWASSDNTVATIDANGLATANNPGLSGIVASAGGVTAQSLPFNTCMPQEIVLHISGDPADKFTFSAVMNVNDTKTVQADMIDINGTAIPSAPVRIVSNNPAVATVGGTTLTATAPGGAGLLAVCSPPTCGNGINRPVYSNLFSVLVNGTSPATTVYAGTTTVPAAGTTPAIVPIDTSKSPPVAGTAINLPGAPTSMAFSKDGSKLYVDTSSGLVAVDPASNAATLVDADPVGLILAVSPDGTKVLVSNVKFQADTASQRLFIFDSSNSTLQTFILPGAVAAAFDNDGFKAYIAANNGNIYVWSPFLTLRTLTLGGTPNSVTAVAAGPLSFVANGTAVNTFNVCDNSLGAAVPTTSAPQLLGSVDISNTIVAANQTGLDITSVTLPVETLGQCPPPASYANQFQDFGVGTFTARQLLVASNGIRAVVLPVGMNHVLVGVPGGSPAVIPLAGSGTEAVSGNLTQDGNTLWAGVAGTTTVDRINLTTGADEFQIQLNLNKTNAVPDLIAVKPK
jgi:trimeric autotransporter adhesin